jgi:hypothetical protein
LSEVRNVTREHQARRGVILHELQDLSSRIGTFPAARREPVAGIEYDEPGAGGQQPALGRNDGSQRARNVQAELQLYFRGRASPR